MKEVGKSTLVGKKFRLEGFAFISHPNTKGMKIQVTIFSELPDETTHLICLSDVMLRRYKHAKRMLAASLGEIVDDETVVPYVQRSVGGANLDGVREAIESGWPGTSFTWCDR